MDGWMDGWLEGRGRDRWAHRRGRGGRADHATPPPRPRKWQAGRAPFSGPSGRSRSRQWGEVRRPCLLFSRAPGSQWVGERSAEACALPDSEAPVRSRDGVQQPRPGGSSASSCSAKPLARGAGTGVLLSIPRLLKPGPGGGEFTTTRADNPCPTGMTHSRQVRASGTTPRRAVWWGPALGPSLPAWCLTA